MGCLPACCFNLKDILDANDKSEHLSHFENCVRIIIDWSEWRDLNYRNRVSACAAQRGRSVCRNGFPVFMRKPVRRCAVAKG